MSRTLRSLVCAGSMLALLSGAAHAQTAPTTIPSTIPALPTFTLPAACQPGALDADVATDDDTRGAHVRACIAALREAGVQHGFGHYIAAMAPGHVRHAHSASEDDDATTPSVTTAATTVSAAPTPGAGATSTTGAGTTSTAALVSGGAGADRHDGEHAHGRGHGRD